MAATVARVVSGAVDRDGSRSGGHRARVASAVVTATVVSVAGDRREGGFRGGDRGGSALGRWPRRRVASAVATVDGGFRGA